MASALDVVREHSHDGAAPLHLQIVSLVLEGGGQSGVAFARRRITAPGVARRRARASGQDDEQDRRGQRQQE
jgi:hypothetical protein